MIYIQKVVHGIGWVVTTLLVTILVLWGIAKVDQVICYPDLQSGTVEYKYWNDGHGWDSSWVFGNYSFTTHHTEKPGYMIAVTDGAHRDYWEVSEEAWEAIETGDTVTRKDVEWRN